MVSSPGVARMPTISQWPCVVEVKANFWDRAKVEGGLTHGFTFTSRIAYDRRRQFRRANNGASSARNRKRGTVFSKISLGGLPEETNRIFNP